MKLTLWKPKWYLAAYAVAQRLTLAFALDLEAIDDEAAARRRIATPPAAAPPLFPWEGGDGTDA